MDDIILMPQVKRIQAFEDCFDGVIKTRVFIKAKGTYGNSLMIIKIKKQNKTLFPVLTCCNGALCCQNVTKTGFVGVYVR